MRNILMVLIMLSSCSPKRIQPDTTLPVLQTELTIQNDSLQKVKTLVLKYANLYVNDINNKMNEDSMEYWSRMQKELQEKIAVTKYSIDSLQKQSVQ